MPPFREEYRDSKPSSREMVLPPPPIHVAPLVDGQHQQQQTNAHNNANNNTTTTPTTSPNNRASARVRYRGGGQGNAQGTLSPRSRRRHITNINRINVINNYAPRSGSGNGPNNKGSSIKSQLGWSSIRFGLALLILLWFGAVATVMKNSSSSTVGTTATGSPPKKGEYAAAAAAHNSRAKTKSLAALNLPRWKQLSEDSRGGLRANGKAHADVAAGAKSELSDVIKSKNDEPKGQLNESAAAPPSIFELSLFGNQSPSDFQLYTPHAPSCSKHLDAASVSFTLVSQLSNDRIWMIKHHCERWGDNPMSIAIFSDRSAEDVKSQLVDEGCSEEHLTVQTVSKTKYDPSGKEYPVNLLRNLAYSAVKTTHIIYADVDFWPSSDLHEILTHNDIRERFASDPKLATVIPVFQMYRRCRDYKDCRNSNIPSMPRNKKALLALIKKKEASTFDPTNVGGHGSTKYITWRDQKTGTFVDLPCIKSNRYEPYLAFRFCSDLPPFQEGFTGYGKNKMTWVMHLRRSGYLFSQLGGAFLVHYPHLDSKARLEWNRKPQAMEKHGASAADLFAKGDKSKIDWSTFKRARVDALFLDFKEWLDGTVEDESRVSLCEDALNDDVRLWVHSNKDDSSEDDEEEEEEEEESESKDTEENANQYENFVTSKRAYDKCEEENSDDTKECSDAAFTYVESSLLWVLAGLDSGELNPHEQIELLEEANACVTKTLSLHDNNAFKQLAADVYVNMGAIEKSRHATDKAKKYITKALELDSKDEVALKIMKKLGEHESDSSNEEENLEKATA